MREEKTAFRVCADSLDPIQVGVEVAEWFPENGVEYEVFAVRKCGNGQPTEMTLRKKRVPRAVKPYLFALGFEVCHHARFGVEK